MAVDRHTQTSATVGTVTGDDFMNAVDEEIFALWSRVAIPLTGVAGTANAITATVTPSFAAWVDGMAFWITPVAANTGAVTLAITGAPSTVDVVDADGAALIGSELAAGRNTLVVYRSASGDLHIVGGRSGGVTGNYQAFTASGTWNKPAGLNDNAIVKVEVWGSGAGGGTNARGGGGGGGAYHMRLMRAVDLASTVAVTIAAGGAISSPGGTSSFGTHVLAYGGGNGNNSGPGAGGGGGGLTSSGNNGTGTTGGAGGGPENAPGSATSATSAGPGDGRFSGGGGGGTSTSASSGLGGNGGGGVWGGGGGGGGGGATGTGGTGGASLWGGAGGGAGSSGVGGTSVYGGNGGGAGAAGTAPGGGGGRNAAGARGECRVTVIG